MNQECSEVLVYASNISVFHAPLHPGFRSESSAAAHDIEETATTAQPGKAVEAITPVPNPRIFNCQFFILAGMATRATFLDITTTSSCISGYATCREANPVLGSHPSSAKIYGVNLPLLAGELFASVWLRHPPPKTMDHSSDCRNRWSRTRRRSERQNNKSKQSRPMIAARVTTDHPHPGCAIVISGRPRNDQDGFTGIVKDHWY
jgi:hypothetical protein